MNTNYTMEDIGKFINDYRDSQGVKPNDLMFGIPLVGKKIYEKTSLEDQKRTTFENAYNKALSGSIEDQEKFISDMTPILDDFYSKNNVRKK